MKHQKGTKRLIFTLPIIIMVSCSSHTEKNNNSSEFTAVINKNSHQDISANKNNNTHYNKYVSLQTEEPQTTRYEENNIVYFGLDTYEITPEFTKILDIQAKFLINHPSRKVIIEGHTDERGSPEYNIAIGERRANSVKMYLHGKGVTLNQITIISYGKEKPILLEHNELAYSKNRRAVLVY